MIKYLDNGDSVDILYLREHLTLYPMKNYSKKFMHMVDLFNRIQDFLIGLILH